MECCREGTDTAKIIDRAQLCRWERKREVLYLDGIASEHLSRAMMPVDDGDDG